MEDRVCKNCGDTVALMCADQHDCILGNMTHERRKEIENDMSTSLTQIEINNGWFFCNFEWDGMLIREGSPEANVCSKLCKCQPIKTTGE